MKMVFRWFGEGNDSVSLQHIKQIPAVEGIVWALHDIKVGEVWPLERIQMMKEQADTYHLHLDVVESVNIHESIKLGLDTRDMYIDNYIETLKNLAKIGVKVVCYNFMPVFDWVRTELFRSHPDQSTAMFYEKAKVDQMNPIELVNRIASNKTFTMPGWELDRLETLKELFLAYKYVSENDLRDNLHYFLERVIPVCESLDIKLAIHPDDPPWSIFGLPRIVTTGENLEKITKLVDSPYNGITFCSGALGVNPKNDLIDIIHKCKERIHFAHIRNVLLFENGDFIETSHLTRDGSLPIDEVMKALSDCNFTGYMRPDHGRHIWGEECRPGYGLYDRALGIMYLHGLWDGYQLKKKEEASYVTNS
ncbi:mannonate dehydratase [Gracilibacillus marinus]|uniref:Mannonate dehydratase n=1 Tax=Gracilibacillus marinus TaxID=630535 RepID=A0ABV8VZW3_9BACI